MNPDLQALLSRVEGAGGPDREIDCRLACALDGFFPVLKEWPAQEGDLWRIDFCRHDGDGLVYPGHGGDQMVRPYSDSLDAALALVERVLPGWRWSVDSERERAAPTDDPRPHGTVIRPDGRPWPSGGATPALALLAALLKALIAKEQNDG